MTDLEQQIEGAKAYEALHVPAVFEQFAPIVLKSAGVTWGDSVLDVACGTGVVARKAVAVVGSDGDVTGIDPAPGMLAVANELETDVDWRQGVASEIPFEDERFDAVVCQFGMMFFPDREAAVREMLRVLKNTGRASVAVWDRLENSDGFREEVDLLEKLAGTEAADALRAPFVLGNKSELLEIFSGAGDVSISTHIGKARFPSIKSLVEADLRGWLPLMGVNLSEEKIASILFSAEEELARYVVEGEVVFDLPAHIVSFRKA